MKNNRLGIIKVSRWLSYNNIELLKEIWQCVTPLFSSYDNTKFQQPIEKFVCYCDKFEEVKECETIPEYILTIKRDGNNEVIDFWVEKEDKNSVFVSSIKEE